MPNDRKPIDSKTQLMLWGRAAGRCEFPGCNKLLYEELLTKKKSNLSNIAHIVADSPDGPRGDKKRSKVLASDINNLMLMCREHHKLIDDYPDDFPEEQLLEMKKDHEDRIKLAGSMTKDMRTQIVLYAANVGKQNAPVAYQDAIDAIQGQFYPAESRPIELGIKNSLREDNEDTYWADEVNNLRTQFDRKILPILSAGDDFNFSVFAIAPMPLLIKLGTLLSDINKVYLYQKHREPQTWKWDSSNMQTVNHLFIKPKNKYGIPVLVLSLSATINDDRIVRVLGENISIWKITIDEPNMDYMRTLSDLQDFRRIMRSAFNYIKATHGMTYLHVFPAMPVSVSVELGRVWMPKADMPMIIYDENRIKGGFYQTLKIE